jgi:hypothetical protein
VTLELAEIAIVLVHLDHIASLIVLARTQFTLAFLLE